MSIARLVDTDTVSADDARELGLNDEEFARACRILGRTPNKVELGCFSAMWSEHCSYKSSRALLGRLPSTGPRVVVGPGENAGVIDLGEGWGVAFKVESHNHPSFIEPYQGAATGVGGILRDVFTMGARPIAAMNLLRFGRPEHPKTPHLLRGVVKGIGDYGNCFGVPTVYSDVDFDACYDGNILVNAFALGLVRNDAIFKGVAEGVGNPVFYVGAKTGRDGIHGATMASDSFSETEELERPTVQVGDPFKEKLLLEACLDAFAADVLVGIQDMGAAGLTSSSFEMASRAGSGLVLDLDRVPTRERGMSAYELMLSESQERMLLVAKRGCDERVRALFGRWDLDCVEVGQVSDDGMVRLRMQGSEVAVLPARELADEAPRYDRPRARPLDADLQLQGDPALVEQTSLEGWLRTLARAPGMAPRQWIYRQFDREVGVGTLADGQRAAAAVIDIPEAKKRIALAICVNQRACAIEPREGARRALAEAVLRVACAGARPIGVTDCLNYGNPQRPDVMWQIAEGIEGIAEACRALDIPVVSGNVSLYNETDTRSIHPTPTIAVVGQMPAEVPPVGLAPAEGSLLVRIGRAPQSTAGSFAAAWAAGRVTGPLGAWHLRQVDALARLLATAAEARILSAARPIAAGGLLGALLDLARASRRGFSVHVPDLAALLGEQEAGVVVAIADGALALLEEQARAMGGDPVDELDIVPLGRMEGTDLRVTTQSEEALLSWADMDALGSAVLPHIAAGSSA